MKAIFKGKADWYTGEYEFTPGVEYDLIDCGDGYFSAIDNNGLYAHFRNGRYYWFECAEEESEKSKEKEMTYRMNGISVTKSFFEDSLREVEILKSRGVSVFIDFEVGF